MMISEKTEQNLKQLLKNYDPIKVASVFSSLLLNPKYHTHQYRLEIAIKSCLVYGNGKRPPNSKIIKDIYHEMKSFEISSQEDPVEDVFISNLWFENKDYKVLLGLWEGGLSSTQLFLKVLETIPNNTSTLKLKNKIVSILRISNDIIEKRNIPINKIGNNNSLKDILTSDLKKVDSYVKQNKVINSSDYDVPVVSITQCNTLLEDQIGNSLLEHNPFYIENNDIFLLLPSAITTSIKKHILDFIIKHNLLDTFLTAVHQSISKEIFDTHIFGKLSSSPLYFNKVESIEDFSFAETYIEFDSGYFFHFIIVNDRMQNVNEEWFAGYLDKENDQVTKYIDSRITNVKKEVLDKDINNKGCSIIVPYGFGRMYMFGSKFVVNESWLVTYIPYHDLITISNDLNVTPQLIWRIIESEKRLQEYGTQILNVNGLLNLYGYVKSNSYSIYPIANFEEEIDSTPFSMICVDSNYNASIREEVAQNTDSKTVIHPLDKAIIIKKAFSDSLFSFNIKSNLYMPNKIDKNTLQVIYSNEEINIWVEQDIVSKLDLKLQYKLFEASITWLCKVLYILKKNSIFIDKKSNLWKLNFEIVENISELKMDINLNDIQKSYVNTLSESTIYTSFNINLLKGFLCEKNYSEQAIVLSILDFLSIDKDKINYLLQEIIVSEDARLLHFFKAHNYREHFDITEKKPTYIQKIDDQIVQLNLGWSIREKSDGHIIEGIEECTKYLNELVDFVWKRIKNKLQTIDREDLIIYVLKNLEYCGLENDVWENTFKSNLALQIDRDNLYEVSIHKINDLNASSLSSRLIIEMAICACSVNCGKKCGELDLQELMCLVAFIHHIGGVSEAIKYEAINPKIVISSFGQVLFDYSFNDLTVKKYGYSFNKQILDSKVDEYSEKFKDIDIVKETNHLFEEDFLEALIDELGYTIDDGRKFIDFLENYGLKLNSLVFTVNYNSLVDIFNDEDKEVYTRILDSFIIHSRRDWTSIPKPYKSTDWQPWKFRRRYSLIMKPIVAVDVFENLLVISPQLVRVAFINFFRNMHEGFLEAEHFQSKKMIKWVGKARKSRGLSFNDDVKEKFIELGFKAREEIKLTEILNKKMLDYGDIDVFAWSKEKNIVYAVECKSLEFAKTYGEIARQIYEFKGQINTKNKHDRLLKHVKRVEMLKEDLKGIEKFTHLDEGFQVKGLVVFSNIVPMNFNNNRNYMDEIPFLIYSELDKYV